MCFLKNPTLDCFFRNVFVVVVVVIVVFFFSVLVFLFCFFKHVEILRMVPRLQNCSFCENCFCHNLKTNKVKYIKVYISRKESI